MNPTVTTQVSQHTTAPVGGTRMRPEPTLKGFPLMSVCGLINLTPGRSKVGLFF